MEKLNLGGKKAEKTQYGWGKGGKNLGKPLGFGRKKWENPGKIGFRQFFSAVLEKIPFFFTKSVKKAEKTRFGKRRKKPLGFGRKKAEKTPEK